MSVCVHYTHTYIHSMMLEVLKTGLTVGTDGLYVPVHLLIKPQISEISFTKPEICEFFWTSGWIESGTRVCVCVCMYASSIGILLEVLKTGLTVGTVGLYISVHLLWIKPQISEFLFLASGLIESETRVCMYSCVYVCIKHWHTAWSTQDWPCGWQRWLLYLSSFINKATNFWSFVLNKWLNLKWN